MASPFQGMVGAGAAGGAVEGLRDILTRRLAEQNLLQRMLAEQNDMQFRQQSLQQQGQYQQGQLAEAQKRTAEDARQFDANAPIRDATLAATNALANQRNAPPVARPIAPVKVDTMEGGRRVTKFLTPDQVMGQTFQAPPPASTQINLGNTQPVYTAGMGEKALEGLNPQEANIIKKLANYEITLPVGIASSREPWVSRLTRAAAYDPTFDQTQYNARQRLRIAFQSQGKPSDNIRALNTAVGHLGTLKTKADALENSPVQLWNTVKNFGLSQSGDPRVVGFLNAATALANELATVFKGTGATDQEIKAWRESLNTSMSPSQLKESINTAISLLGSRLEALTKQYETGMGKPKDFRLLYDRSRAILQGLGADVDALDPALGGGTSASAAAQATGGYRIQNGKLVPIAEPVK